MGWGDWEGGLLPLLLLRDGGLDGWMGSWRVVGYGGERMAAGTDWVWLNEEGGQAALLGGLVLLLVVECWRTEGGGVLRGRGGGARLLNGDLC